MQDLPKFSVITVVRNDLDGFQTTARSISEQNYSDFEWIVVDGDSSDGTRNAIDSLRSSRLTWISETDDGIYDAMNKGVAMTNSDYVVFLNAGDEFGSPGTLGNVANSIARSVIVPDVVLGGALLVFQNGGTRLREPRCIENIIWHGLPAVHQSTFYRTERIKLCPYDLQYSICGDYYLIVKLYLEGVRGLYLLDDPVCKFKIGGLSHQSKKKLIREPWQIQRDVLQQNIVFRIASITRRIAATAVVSLLQRQR